MSSTLHDGPTHPSAKTETDHDTTRSESYPWDEGSPLQDATASPDLGALGGVVGRRGRRTRVLVVMTVAAMVVAVVTVLMLAPRYDLQRVQSMSMAPTVEPGDVLLVDTRAYEASGPKRGDVIVFTDPGGWGDPDPMRGEATGQLYVKRVVGVGGDHVYCCGPERRLEVNGQAVDEDYLPDEGRGRGLRFNAVVPAERLWVLGDNRASSIDSRHLLDSASLGYVAESDVVGRVALTVPFPDRTRS